MLDWRNLVRLPDWDLAKVDIASVNLACAVGLPGSDQIDFGRCLRILDAWAGQSRCFTERVLPLFHGGRCDYPESEPRFRIQALVTYLQRDLGLRFRFDRRSDDAVYEPVDSFLHGILQGQGGTCGSLPVLYVAVGRRLGYPLKLATTRCHLYVRWDALAVGECFNIEASGDGVSFFPDDYYRTGRFAMAQETEEACGHLRSLSPREELAGFLVQRGGCRMQEGVYGDAATSFAWAHELAPRHRQHALLTVQALQKWDEQLRALLPPRHFPILDIELPPWQFANWPREVERELARLHVLEGLLRDSDCERRWWRPLRQNPSARPRDLPGRLRLGTGINDRYWDSVSSRERFSAPPTRC